MKNFEIDLKNCGAFIIAVTRGKYEIVKFLIDNKIDLTSVQH